MLVSIVINGAMGFAMAIAVIFCMGDIEAATESATGYPIIDIFTYATGSVAGGTGLVSVLLEGLIRRMTDLLIPSNILNSISFSLQHKFVYVVVVLKLIHLKQTAIILSVNIFSVTSVLASASRMLWVSKISKYPSKFKMHSSRNLDC